MKALLLRRAADCRRPSSATCAGEKIGYFVARYPKNCNFIQFGVQGCPWTSFKHAQAFKSRGTSDKAGNSAGV